MGRQGPASWISVPFWSRIGPQMAGEYTESTSLGRPGRKWKPETMKIATSASPATTSPFLTDRCYVRTGGWTTQVDRPTDISGIHLGPASRIDLYAVAGQRPGGLRSCPC
jgi:hypothetical protein